MNTLIFKTQLLDRKSIQREVEVLESCSLYDLAEAIINSYGFDFDHAFGFFSKITRNWDFKGTKGNYELFADMQDRGIEPVDSGSVEKTRVADVWKHPKDQMLFLFDYGDDWRWIVTLKTIGEKQAGVKYPRVLSAKGNAPEQYPEAEEE